MSLSMGLQLFSVRTELQKDFLGTLQRLASIGYENLELAIHNTGSGLQPGGNMNAAEMRKHLKELNMKIVSTHLYPLDKVDWNELIDFNHEIGSSAIVCPIEFFDNKNQVLEFCTQLNHYGEKCKQGGLQFYYHNHFQEFQKFEGQYIMDILLEQTDKDLVKVEFDTYWALRGGVNPVDYLRKLGDRCDMIHQKDLPKTVQPVNFFDAIGEDTHIDMDRFTSLLKPQDFAEIGEGMIDIAAILEVIRERDTFKYIFVEQDLTIINELNSVELSYKNIKQLM